MNVKDRETLRKLHDIGIKIADDTKRNVQCYCHLHDEKSPSFFYHLDTEMYNCFSCGLKGRGFNNLLYAITGKRINLPDKIAVLTSVRQHTVIPKIPSLPLALDNPGQVYLNGRGYTNDSIKKWNLQYWEERHAVVIPIKNVGYILRWIIPPKDEPSQKYKYIPGTRIETTLFGIENFKSVNGYAILVEGSLDVIWCHQVGYSNTLGILHSDISEIQINILKSVTSKVFLCLDPDIPGKIAMQKIKSKLSSNFIVRICNLPDGKDPNECDFDTLQKVFLEATSII